MNINRQTILSFALVALLVGSVAASATAAAGNSEINYSEGPDVYVYEERVDIAEHNRSAMDSLLEYYGDDGGVKTLPASLNESVDEQVKLRYDNIADDDLRKFPRSGGTALDAANWTTSGASVSSTENALTFSASSVTSGSTGSATYDRVDISSDVNKRVMFAVLNVENLDSAAEVTIRAVDSDGDFKATEINSSASTDSVDVAATATGNGYVFQQKLVDLPVRGSGDGQLDGIRSVKIVSADANATVTLTALDLERKSITDLGETMRDEDGDGTEEAVTFTEISQPGEIGLTGLDTLPGMFDDATITNLGVMGVEYRASDQPADDVDYNFSSADNYPSYPSKLDAYQRVKVPTAIDISHNNLEMRAEQQFIGERYKVVRMAEGTGDTEFGNISSWTDLSDTYTAQGDTHVLDASIQPGQSYVWNGLVVLQDDEVRTLQETGGTGAPVQSNGGILGSMWTWISGVIAMLTGGYVKLRGE